MGNKIGTKKKSSSSDGTKKSEVKKRPKKNGTSASNSSREKKVISCPDLSGAVPYKFEEDQSNVDVKIYRSYSNVADPTDKRLSVLSADPNPDIRVYRRSTAHLPQVGVPDKSQTLPRSFGRSRHSLQEPSQGQQSNGTLVKHRRTDSSSGPVARRSTLGGSSFNEGKGSKRTLSTASMNSIGYKVHPEDFPDTSTIKRKLNLFETSFVRHMVEVFCGGSISDTVQLSLLSIAIRPDHANQQVSLLQYLQSNDIPANLLEQTNSDQPDYILTIPPVLFRDVLRLRREKVEDISTWVIVGRQILTCQAMEAANELSRVFEYQLALMPEGLPLDMLCRNSAQCVPEFLKRQNKLLDRNTVVHGVIKGHVRVPDVCPKFSVIIGERELKWTVFEIFKKPGLRKEIFLLAGDMQDESDLMPWKFYTSLRSDTMLYGYRGLTVDWDFASFSYQLNGEDEASFPDEIDWRPDDFHRDYCPYRRLVGLSVMRDFCSLRTALTSKGMTLGDYVKQIQGRAFARDRIQPVYRPLGGGDGLRDQLPLGAVNLGNADTLRLRKGRTKPGSPSRASGVTSPDTTVSSVDDDDVTMATVSTGTKSPTGRAEISPRSSNFRSSPRSASSGSGSRHPAARQRMPFGSSTGSETGTGTGSPLSSRSRGSEIESGRRNGSEGGNTTLDETDYDTARNTPQTDSDANNPLPVSNHVTTVVEPESDADDSAAEVAPEKHLVRNAVHPVQVSSTLNKRSTITSDV